MVTGRRRSCQERSGHGGPGNGIQSTSTPWPYPFRRRGGRDEWQWCGARTWQDVSQWAEVNVFITAKREGWLEAVRYFSSMSLRSMKAWSLWEQTDEQWRVAMPKQFPMYAQWQCEVAAVTRLSNPDGTAQHLLDSVRGLPEAEWSRLLSGFSDLIAFSLWMELVLDMEGSNSELASKELTKRYGGFNLAASAIGSKEAVRSLNNWAIEHALGIASQEHMLAALSFHVSHHPAYYALRSYALHCHDVWPDECLAHPPSFAEWREAADAYFKSKLTSPSTAQSCGGPALNLVPAIYLKWKPR